MSETRDPAVAARALGARGELAGVGLVATATLAFGALPVIAALGFGSGMTIGEVVGVRTAVAGLLLLALALVVEGAAQVRRLLTPSSLVLGALFGLQATGYFLSIREVGAALTSIIYYAYPVFIAFGERLVYNTPVGRRAAVALGLSCCGMTLLVGGAHGQLGWGVVVTLASMAGYAAYLMLAQHVRQTSSPIASSALTLTLSGLLCALVAAPLEGGLALPSGAAGWGEALGLMATLAIGVPCLLAGIARLGSTRAAILSAMDPVVAAVLAVIVLGESLPAIGWLGGALVTCSAVVIALSATSMHSREAIT